MPATSRPHLLRLSGLSGLLCRCAPLWLTVLVLLCSLAAGCGNDAPPTGAAVENRDSMPVMVTRGVSKLISDSGLVRYKIISEEWRVYDKTTPQRQEFLRGIYFQRFSTKFTPDLYIIADTAFCYNNSLWDLRGNVFIKNFENATTFATAQLYWDMNRHEIWSYSHMHIITPDRDLEGDAFRSNEAMTRYHISRSKGFVPMPRDGEESTDDEVIIEEDTTEMFDPLPPRERPTPRRKGVAPEVPEIM